MAELTLFADENVTAASFPPCARPGSTSSRSGNRWSEPRTGKCWKGINDCHHHHCGDDGLNREHLGNGPGFPGRPGWEAVLQPIGDDEKGLVHLGY